MKKLYFSLFIVIFLSVFLGSIEGQANENSLANGYYTVSPKLNSKLQVGYKFQLKEINSSVEKHEFYYVPSEKGYVINDQYNSGSVKWNGSTSVKNLIWTDQLQYEPAMIWTVEEVSNNNFIIRNKKDPSMVWGIDNSATIGASVKLEKQKSLSDPLLNKQIFILTKWKL